MNVEFFSVDDSERMREALAIRIAVFVDEQGVPLDMEIDEHDRDDQHAVHALVRDETGAAIAAGRYYLRDDGGVQIGRMAVLEDARGRHAGMQLLVALMNEARSHGHSHAVLSAQTHAVAFYRKAGFVHYGEIYDDAGIAHVNMRSSLTPMP